ncbi:MAG TPA: SDR family oxidoreductase [Conexibacter sp.]|jgi:NAD(P)-dependent dehydrogenase (short-subunit alcohol dehydrogenase family)
MGKLDGRVVIVTGAARGIGRACAAKLAQEGAAVVVADLNGAGAEAAGRELDCFAVQGDVSLEQDAERIVAEALEQHGRVDALVHAAAIVPFVAWDDVDYAYWCKIISVNLDGTYLMGRAVERPMRAAGYGRIVNIASNAYFAATPNMGPYLAAKGGVIGLTRAQATELGRHGITANAIAPGITRSEAVMESAHREALDFVASLQALPRHAEPEDIAPTVAFLASEESGWVTGQTIVVDAGHIRS